MPTATNATLANPWKDLWNGDLSQTPKIIDVDFVITGTDTLRIAQGKIVEYWANADSLLFVQQLGLSEVPGTVRGQ